MTISSNSPKDKWIALCLCLFLGVFGAHKFYEGKTGLGAIYLILSSSGFFSAFISTGLIGFLCFIDLIVILFKPNPYYPK